MLEAIIANHCAPALAGIKPANIVSCKKTDGQALYENIRQLNHELNGRDIYIEILCECHQRVLLIVYRRKVLDKHLNHPMHQAFLARYGYTTKQDLRGYLNRLKMRLDCDRFPHEIGVFLGYPLRDIDAFIHHRDEGCLLVGEWRVYHNAEEAEALFGRFRACKKAVAQKVAEGKTLAQIFCAA